jgi:hypothetical protein
MNNDLVMQAADALADRLLKLPESKRLSMAYELAFSRDIHAMEAQRGRDFITVTDAALASDLSDAKARESRVWSLYCQTLFMTNEFLYLR